MERLDFLLDKYHKYLSQEKPIESNFTQLTDDELHEQLVEIKAALPSMQEEVKSLKEFSVTYISYTEVVGNEPEQLSEEEIKAELFRRYSKIMDEIFGDVRKKFEDLYGTDVYKEIYGKYGEWLKNVDNT
ncbi:hypothetical protein A2229_02175 [Candidatus Peregrinibacteria bacterium RIFOXYA2_FULL_33_7]|nr:MAG: hypothetical protein A2229_02175 [Candidatus Peregrinibacteria bacterium RIFOXYA2_FULL_33_7]